MSTVLIIPFSKNSQHQLFRLVYTGNAGLAFLLSDVISIEKNIIYSICHFEQQRQVFTVSLPMVNHLKYACQGKYSLERMVQRF
jgi:hypothetical protein